MEPPPGRPSAGALATGRDLDHAGPFRLERAEGGDDKDKERPREGGRETKN